MDFPCCSQTQSSPYQRVNQKRFVDLINVVNAWCEIVLF